ncbi:MAG: glycerophosphodiester phosphodiesterase family protein [Spirochaetales bacterium]|uniref:Glycerophosphodiester phosphodiesterase family protein n=1 Tax=Candidatus Thalassospirochaeta sargassi TaxID=3119039 RepID=A0AAJ1II32_9SPIO|nr:glycerophosphodiester phosphodiesterase family protein [Spirochaetales bacterium]
MKIYPDEKEPYIFAHRGYSSIAPENTLPAFSEAMNRGIPGLELDIHLCRSGELVVTHDHNLKRVTGFDGIIEELDYTDIRNLDAGSWKGEKYTGEKIPLLEDLFDLVGDRLYYDIEIKSRRTDRTGIEEKLYRLIKSRGLQERCIVSSFNPMPLKYFKEIAPHIPTAIIYCSNSEVPWYLRNGEGRWIASADILKPEHIKINGAFNFFNRISGKRPVLPWTVDEPAEAARLIAAGVNGIISNDPGGLF